MSSFANQNIPLLTPSANAAANNFNLLKYYESSNNNNKNITKNELNYLQLEKAKELNQLEINTSEIFNRYNLVKNSKFENINYLANKQDETANSNGSSSSHETLLTSSLLSYEGKYNLKKRKKNRLDALA